MVTLQKIKCDEKTRVCVYTPSLGDGERTLCGLVIMDAGMYDTGDYSPVGRRYEGKLSDVTCPDCLSIINFVREADNA